MPASLVRAAAVALLPVVAACAASASGSSAAAAPADSAATSAIAERLHADGGRFRRRAPRAACRVPPGDRRRRPTRHRDGLRGGAPRKDGAHDGTGVHQRVYGQYHLKRIYSAYGDYLNHTLAPVLELHANGAVIGDYTWDGLALSEKAGQGS